ncbi:hypothetical protein BDZ89DRAFT_1059219 [Hymenopellis radicata]|nr:hypothetical protein BDZ89DRAFT_1059219 [Hymenopellis radicata]
MNGSASGGKASPNTESPPPNKRPRKTRTRRARKTRSSQSPTMTTPLKSVPGADDFDYAVEYTTNGLYGVYAGNRESFGEIDYGPQDNMSGFAGIIAFLTCRLI